MSSLRFPRMCRSHIHARARVRVLYTHRRSLQEEEEEEELDTYSKVMVRGIRQGDGKKDGRENVGV